ncbi:hypothetical protein BDV32DRAFT_135559 [Aspergillus pseudonomiae]|uniref:6-methylsalicylate decarboxylase n=1 Tax=Aspergillus pseudonomiae TaxID=1506151 RepID=A0A5N7DGX0_9EURO|nr:uncharacterized protein BDV37DRAFT_293030 [Aspergillus pseudonomiae]KAB8264236.1 hypothetical protein BDV32DRAFT_135559 [Aspergillus pseudonomiae]KAE8405544.1 hypothetical protein BDV37DRAFT_293030 [Aspergillus pseudonomiae]
MRISSSLLFTTLLSGLSGSAHAHGTKHHHRLRDGWHLTDTHIHVLPPFYVAAVAKAGGDPSGFPTPEWSLEGTLRSMESVGSKKAVVSLSTPGVPVMGTGKKARTLCRNVNDFLANLTQEAPTHLEFFGALPDWRDVDGTLAEIDYIFKTQKAAVGVGMYTAYGDMLPGDPTFDPIWERLNMYKALVFMHPGVMDVKPAFVAGVLPQPIIDYPQQTTRAAVDLVLRGVRTRTQDVDLILSHAGGTLPYLSTRALGSLVVPQVSSAVNVTIPQVKAEFRRFYYDIALSTTETQLTGLLLNTDTSHVLYGSDYPYAPAVAIAEGKVSYLSFAHNHPELGPDILSKNAKDLLVKHRLSANLDE